MRRTLLAERFKLVAQTESREPAAQKSSPNWIQAGWPRPRLVDAAGKVVKYQHITDTALHQRAAKGE
jgi:hypothetical protein